MHCETEKINWVGFKKEEHKNEPRTDNRKPDPGVLVEIGYQTRSSAKHKQERQSR